MNLHVLSSLSLTQLPVKEIYAKLPADFSEILVRSDHIAAVSTLRESRLTRRCAFARSFTSMGCD